MAGGGIGLILLMTWEKVTGGGYDNTDIATVSFMPIRRLATFRLRFFRLLYRPE